MEGALLTPPPPLLPPVDSSFRYISRKKETDRDGINFLTIVIKYILIWKKMCPALP